MRNGRPFCGGYFLHATLLRAICFGATCQSARTQQRVIPNPARSAGEESAVHLILAILPAKSRQPTTNHRFGDRSDYLYSPQYNFLMYFFSPRKQVLAPFCTIIIIAD
jgi:hypothetical protein